MPEKRKLWLIDAGYMFNARHSVRSGYEFSYLKLRQYLEQDGPIWRAYYLNSTPNPPSDAQDNFHRWLRSGPPFGPKIITKFYSLKQQRADKAYCEECGQKVQLRCQNQTGDVTHRVFNEIQKGVDVAIATLSLINQNNYDTLLLSSGDSDLLDAVEYLSVQGKGIELVVFRDGVSSELQCRADHIHWINDFATEVDNLHRDSNGEGTTP
ncbi:MAG: NYN domain-containing protein [Deltaproteobacteria bacterium]|nr:NYN domain-containing protein [Deltaproteobacteria bacterium]